MTSTAIDISGLNALRDQVTEFRNQMKEQAKIIVKEGSAAIFEEYGDIVHSFGWTQYAPYFNDGDPCEFSVHECAVIAQVDVDENEDPDYLHEWNYDGSPSFQRYTGRSKIGGNAYNADKVQPADPRYVAALEACKTVHSIFYQDETLAKDIFGDDGRVIFTADGVEVEEYDHE